MSATAETAKATVSTAHEIRTPWTEFRRILAGSRISLSAGLLSVVIGAVIGTFFGLLAGYYEGWWDRIVMRVADVLFAFPGILLAIGVVAIFVTVLAFNLLGDGLRDALDPKLDRP